MGAAVYTSGQIVNGRLKVRQADVFSDQLKRLRDGEVEIRVERKLANRSQQANRYYWGVVLRYLSEHTGYHVDELHDHFKKELLPKQVALCDADGVVLQESIVGGSTARLDTEQFMVYVNRIIQIAAEMGCVIPDVDSV